MDSTENKIRSSYAEVSLECEVALPVSKPLNIPDKAQKNITLHRVFKSCFCDFGPPFSSESRPESDIRK